MLTVTLLGTGGPVPDPHRAGPATLVSAGPEQYLVDAGRGVLMRLAAAGSGGEYRALAAEHFDGAIEVGDDLHRVELGPGGLDAAF